MEFITSKVRTGSSLSSAQFAFLLINLLFHKYNMVTRYLYQNQLKFQYTTQIVKIRLKRQNNFFTVFLSINQNYYKFEYFIQIISMKKNSIFPLIVVGLIIIGTYSCIHDQIMANATFHFFEDLSTEKLSHKMYTSRRLQSLVTPARDKIRIYADYSQILTGGVPENTVIKRVVNISANFFYNTLKVDRLDILKFPSNVELKCNVLNVPQNYVTTGVIGDLGILVGNQDTNETYVARSQPCALLKSNNRPMWGMIMFNNRNLGYTQVDFQRSVSVGVHQMTHVLGFSSALYEKYPAGNPFVVVNDYQYLKSAKILKQIQDQFNCTNAIGLPLQDQDGSYNSSHWERKVMGNEYMIAISKKQAHISRLTLALLDSTGWYDVNYTYAQPSGWGKNKGCNFLNVDICGTDQFCPITADPTNLRLDCDWDGTAYGSCLTDPLAGSCNVISYYSNTMCMDDSYDSRKLTSSYQAAEKGGFNSRCFNSTFKAIGAVPNYKLDFRCYPFVCTSTFLYVKFMSYILVCRTPGQEIAAPSGFEGILRCPSFKNYCQQNKKTCSSNCNKNGICIIGLCLCTGSTTLTTSCIDQSNLTVNSNTTGGLTKSIIIDNGQSISLVNSHKKFNAGKGTNTLVISTTRSINTRCIQGTFYDAEFGECVKCKEIFGCDQCTEKGCLECSFNSVGQCKAWFNNRGKK